MKKTDIKSKLQKIQELSDNEEIIRLADEVEFELEEYSQQQQPITDEEIPTIVDKIYPKDYFVVYLRKGAMNGL